MGLLQIELSLSLSYTAQRSLWDADDLENYLLPITIRIIGTDQSQKLDKGTPADQSFELGTLELQRIQVSKAINEGVPLFDVFDVRQETMDTGSILYDSSFKEFCPMVERLFPDASPYEDILLIHRFEIHPFARGKNVGLATLHQAIRDWESGCSLVVLKSYPLQFEVDAKKSPSWDALNLGVFSQIKAPATKRLSAYYQRLGFRRIGRTPYYAISPACKWLKLDPEILPKSIHLLRSALPEQANSGGFSKEG